MPRSSQTLSPVQSAGKWAYSYFGSDLELLLWTGTTRASFDTEGRMFSHKQAVKTVVRGTDSSWVHCFSKCERTSSGTVAFLVYSFRCRRLTCVYVTSTLVTVSSHCCFRRGEGCRGSSTLFFSMKWLARSR